MIELNGVTKLYSPAAAPALENLSLKVERGEVVALLGPSGAGKSTLIRCINGLVQPTSGQVLVDGQDVAVLRGRALQSARRKSGLIFQEFHLIDRYSALVNVLSGALGRYPFWRGALGLWRREDVAFAKELLDRVGLKGFEKSLARDLSGGQRQRVAIARAMMQRPAILLGDEPVASLDPATSRQIMRLMVDLAREEGLTLVVSLHDLGIAREFCPRAVAVKGGHVVYDGPMTGVTESMLTTIYGPGMSSGSESEPAQTSSAQVALAKGCGVSR